MMIDCDDFGRPERRDVKALKILVRDRCSDKDRRKLMEWMQHAFTNSGHPRTGHDHLGR